MTATLDAPIPMGTPGGTELLVGVTVTVPDETGAEHPVEGTPVYLALVGRDGATTRAMGAADRTPGHYTMRIVVPEGGARGIEVGIHGTSDLAIMVAGETLVFGDVTATTAQVAPPLAPALTPFPRAANPSPTLPRRRCPPPCAAAPDLPAPLLVAVAIGGLVLLTGGLLLARRRRAMAAGHLQPRPRRVRPDWIVVSGAPGRCARPRPGRGGTRRARPGRRR